MIVCGVPWTMTVCTSGVTAVACGPQAASTMLAMMTSEAMAKSLVRILLLLHRIDQMVQM
jgi:hypothetical protein